MHQRLVQEVQRGLEPAADHLQLADALVGLFAAEPFADAGHRPAQRCVEGGESRDGVLRREPDLRPARLVAQRGSDADRLLSTFGLAEARRHPRVRHCEKVRHPGRCRHSRRRSLGKGFPGRAEVRLPLQLVEQAMPEPLQQRDQARAVDLLPQAPRRRVLQVVCLVDDQVVVLGQETSAEISVSEQERVIDDDQVGGLGLGAGAMDVAVLFSAVDADAVQRVARNAVPQDLLATVKAQLRAVTALGRVQPEEDLELEHELIGVLARLGQVPPPAAK